MKNLLTTTLLTLLIFLATFEVRELECDHTYLADDQNNLLERHTDASSGLSIIRHAYSGFRGDLSHYSHFKNSLMRKPENQTPAQALQLDVNQLDAINSILVSTPKIRRFSIKLYSKYVRLHGYSQKRMLIATAPTLGEAITQLKTQAAALSS